MSYPKEWDTKAPRLARIAKWINEHTTLIAAMEKGYCNTDRKIPGTRLRHPGKGRNGTRIKVWANEKHRWACGCLPNAEQKKLRKKYGDRPLLDHNAAETYRYNGEVVHWLRDYLEQHPEVLQ